VLKIFFIHVKSVFILASLFPFLVKIQHINAGCELAVKHTNLSLSTKPEHTDNMTPVLILQDNNHQAMFGSLWFSSLKKVNNPSSGTLQLSLRDTVLRLSVTCLFCFQL